MVDTRPTGPAMKSRHEIQGFVLGFMLELAKDLGLDAKDLKTVRRRVSTEGVEFLTKTLPVLGKALDQGIAHGRFKLPTNFKRVKRGWEIPAFLGSFIRAIFSHDGALLPDFCVTSCYVVRQFCFAANKVEIPYTPDQCAAVIQKFVSTEDDVRGLDFPVNDPVLSLCRVISESVFSDFDESDLPYRDGPGISSNCAFTKKQEKRLEPNLNLYKRGLGRHFFFNSKDAMTRLERYPVNNHRSLFSEGAFAKVILVPKDSKGPRLISCEPQETQFIQQGIMDYMVQKLENHPLTRGQVNFSDQSVNQRMAIEASLYQEFSTIDLSEASDRISLRLVYAIFSGSKLLEPLLATRSAKTILPDGSILPLWKFAPMGSALCFTVLSWCLYSIVYSVLLLEGLAPSEARTSVYVYGDDLVIPSAYADKIIDRLETFGLKVNRDKSFINSRFAESCGVDAISGNNVTPVRLRKCPSKKDPSTLISIVQTANQLAATGCFSSAEYLYSHWERYHGRLPYGTARSPYVSRLKVNRPDLIPELNFLTRGIKWKKKRCLQRYPLGSNLIAYAIRPLLQHSSESLYGRLMRTWRSIGCESEFLLSMGEFPRPRSIALRRAEFDHYSQQE